MTLPPRIFGSPCVFFFWTHFGVPFRWSLRWLPSRISRRQTFSMKDKVQDIFAVTRRRKMRRPVPTMILSGWSKTGGCAETGRRSLFRRLARRTHIAHLFLNQEFSDVLRVSEHVRGKRKGSPHTLHLAFNMFFFWEGEKGHGLGMTRSLDDQSGQKEESQILGACHPKDWKSDT